MIVWFVMAVCPRLELSGDVLALKTRSKITCLTYKVFPFCWRMFDWDAITKTYQLRSG